MVLVALATALRLYPFRAWAEGFGPFHGRNFSPPQPVQEGDFQTQLELRSRAYEPVGHPRQLQRGGPDLTDRRYGIVTPRSWEWPQPWVFDKGAPSSGLGSVTVLHHIGSGRPMQLRMLTSLPVVPPILHEGPVGVPLPEVIPL